MHIRLIDLDDDAEVHEYYTVFRDAELADNPDRPMWSEPEMMAHFKEPDDAEDSFCHGAFEGTEQRLVGGSFTFYPLLDNTSMVYAAIFVAPGERRHGFGSALVDDVVNKAVSDGRTTVLSQSTYAFDRRDDHPYRRFAEHLGFTAASTEISRKLDLPLPDDQLQGWIDEAAPFHGDYRLETFASEMPDSLLPSVCHVLNQLIADAPTGDLEFEPEQMTPEIYRQREARNKRLGLERYDTVAIDASGSAVAVTTIGVPVGDPEKFHQWATIVLKEHRGHRLGLALKARNLRAVQRDHPQRTSIHTQNEETNGPMVDINERMGFKPLELVVEFQRKLDA